MDVVSSCTTQTRSCETFPVEIVVSSPRIHPWLLRVPGSQILTSINTTHWGLKVGPSYHDLKMRGLWKTRPETVFAPTLDVRDERAIGQSIFVGKTHFTNEEIQNFAKHQVLHTPCYHFWYDNCQKFAMNSLARRIVCLECSDKESAHDSRTQRLALSSLAMIRPLEITFMVAIILIANIDSFFVIDTETSSHHPALKDIYCAFLRLLHIATLLRLSHHAERVFKVFEEDDSAMPDCESVSRGRAAGLRPPEPESHFNKEDDLWSCIDYETDTLLYKEAETSAVDDLECNTTGMVYTGKNTNLISMLWLLVTSLWAAEALVKAPTLERLIVVSGFMSGLYIIKILGSLVVHYLYGQPYRNVPNNVGGLCKVCSACSNLRACRAALCRLGAYNLSTMCPESSKEKDIHWSRGQDMSFLGLRIRLGLLIAVLANHIFRSTPANHTRMQFFAQYLLSSFSPVTPIGHDIRICVLMVDIWYAMYDVGLLFKDHMEQV